MSTHWKKTTDKMHKHALKLGQKLHPAVKISSDGEFTSHLTDPYDEHLHRREDKCNLTTYSIRTDWCYFRVFITNSSSNPVELFPVRIDARGIKKPLPSITVQPHQEGVVSSILQKLPNSDEDGMQILDANGSMLLELRFRGVAARDEFRKAQQYLDPFSDDVYYSAEEGPPTPRPRTPVSALAIVPFRTHREELRRKNAFNPYLHDGETNARFERMHALLG